MDPTGLVDQWWRPCNPDQEKACKESCEAQGKEFESCAVRRMAWKGLKGGKIQPQSADPSNGGMSCSCKEKQPENSCPDCVKNASMAVGAGGAAYLTYRCLRMIPSLAPPLWWTIPENVAIP
jgi:hypothetical protein